jgi:hypothetical protein
MILNVTLALICGLSMAALMCGLRPIVQLPREPAEDLAAGHATAAHPALLRSGSARRPGDRRAVACGGSGV